MLRAVYPGSFDPITNGHLYIAARAAGIFDELVIGVLQNVEKKGTFGAEERCQMARDALSHLPNIKIASFGGLLVEFMRLQQSRVIIRGLRALSDFEQEFQLAQMNRHLAPEIETMFIATEPQHAYLSSKGVKEVFYFGGSIKEMVPAGVLERMKERIQPIKAVM